MIKFYLFCRKIHRIFVLTIVVLTIIMAGTGSLLKYSSFASKISFIDLGLVRYLHNNLSPWFTLALVIMTLTGLVMYFYPWYIKRKKVISLDNQE